MYAALWRRLPGPAPVRALLAVALVGVVVVVLFRWVFPTVESWLPYDETTVSTSGAGVTLSPTALLTFLDTA